MRQRHRSFTLARFAESDLITGFVAALAEERDRHGMVGTDGLHYIIVTSRDVNDEIYLVRGAPSCLGARRSKRLRVHNERFIRTLV